MLLLRLNDPKIDDPFAHLLQDSTPNTCVTVCGVSGERLFVLIAAIVNY